MYIYSNIYIYHVYIYIYICIIYIYMYVLYIYILAKGVKKTQLCLLCFQQQTWTCSEKKWINSKC